MRIMSLAAAVAALALAPGSVRGQIFSPDPRVPLISATGSGEAHRPPDYAVVTIGLLAKGSSPGGTTAELDRLLGRIRDTLRVHGVPDSSISSGTRRLEPQRTYPQRDITGYTAGISLEVSLRDLGKLGLLLDALAAAGATEIPEVRFESDDEEGAFEEALAEAVAEATSRARAAARAAGGRLGAVVLIDPDSRYAMFLEHDFTRMESPQAQEARATSTAGVTIYWRFEGR